MELVESERKMFYIPDTPLFVALHFVNGGSSYLRFCIGMGTLGTLVVCIRIMVMEWVYCEKLILDQCSLMGQIIETGTDGLYLLISSMCPPSSPPLPPDFRFFVFVS